MLTGLLRAGRPGFVHKKKCLLFLFLHARQPDGGVAVAGLVAGHDQQAVIIGGENFGIPVMGDQGVGSGNALAAAEISFEDETVGFGGDDMRDFGKAWPGLWRRRNLRDLAGMMQQRGDRRLHLADGAGFPMLKQLYLVLTAGRFLINERHST